MTQSRGSAANSAALSGAVDLSALKSRTDAQQQAPGSGAGGQQPAGSGGPVMDITEADFQSEVVERSMQTLVVVDLWADWCGPCKQLSPVLERLANEANGAWVLAKVDVDANPRISQLFGAQSIPTVVAVAGGQPVDAFSGALPEPKIREWITSLLDALRDRLPGVQAAENAAPDADTQEQQAQGDPRFAEAEEAFDQGDFDAAEAAYQRILQAEPGNEQAKSALAQLRFTVRASQLDQSAITRADEDPANVDAQIAAADFEVAQQAAANGFARLIAAVRRTAGADRDRVREHLLGLFELFDQEDERIIKARRDLASALF